MLCALVLRPRPQHRSISVPRDVRLKVAQLIAPVHEGRLFAPLHDVPDLAEGGGDGHARAELGACVHPFAAVLVHEGVHDRFVGVSMHVGLVVRFVALGQAPAPPNVAMKYI